MVPTNSFQPLTLISLFVLLLLTMPDAQAQLGSLTTGGGLSPVPTSLSNDPDLVVSPWRTPRGPVVNVSYTLEPGYGNKIDLLVIDSNGVVWVNETHAIPTGRFTLPVDSWDLFPGKYRTEVHCMNLVHTARMRILP